MQDTVLIILASVVALIVIVVLLGLRYLRADDDEDFVDVAEGRSAGTARERGRARGHQDVRSAGRSGPGAMRGGAEQGGSWDRHAGREGDRTRERPDRGQAPLRKTSRRVSDDSGELVGAAARSGGSRDARAERGERARRDERNDSTGPGWPREVSERRHTSPGGRPAEARDARNDRSGYRESPDQRGTAHRGGGSDDRRGAASTPRREESLPDVRPRRGKREGEDNWPSTEWDDLSDVDYWAELASDKPLPEAPQSAPTSSRAARTDSRRDTGWSAGRRIIKKKKYKE